MYKALILPLPKDDKLINTARSQTAEGDVASDEPQVKRTNYGEFVFDYFIGVSVVREEAREVVYKRPEGPTPKLSDGC